MSVPGIPMSYDYANANTAVTTPSTVHVQNTQLARFFQRYLLKMAMSVYEWEMPETWDKDYFLAVLYSYGYIAIINTDKFGVIPQQCGLGGYNVFYRPRYAIIANPLLKSMQPEIDRDCTLIKFQNDYCGVWDLISYYASLMALTAETAGVNILNSKLSYVFAVGSKSAAESMKALYDRIASGEPMAVYDKAIHDNPDRPPWTFFEQNVGQNYIADKLLIDLIKIENMFKTVIGIPSSNTEKKERVNTLEVTSNDVATVARAADWLERLQDGVKKAKAMFPELETFSVNWRFDPPTVNGDQVAGEKGGETDAR